MKSKLIWGISIGLLLLLGANSGCSNYNRIVKLDESRDRSWGDVQTAYQRRADLIPNLVNIVESYANFEKSTFEAVTQARASATQVKIDPSNMTPESLKQFDAAQFQLGQTLSRLLVSMEKYPELKANTQFTELTAELAGTENRISVARRKFNENVQSYNQDIRTFPASVWAWAFGFNKSVYFEADAGSQSAPKIRMNIK